jgi:nitrate reductase gamma subunit
MKNTPVVGMIGAGIVALVLAWAIGGYVASTVFQNQPLLNKMETSSGKIGASIAILGVAFLLGRYLFRTFSQVLVCFITTEILVFLVIVQCTGLWTFTWFDFSFNMSWLFTMTWNVAVAYFIGAGIGNFLNKKVPNKSFHIDAPHR